MSLSQINTQYKFGEVTNISFSNIFGHVFKCIIGVQAMAQQYMAAKKHGHSIMFEQEVPVIRYGSGSNASYLQLDHNHCIISILFIHVMEHYNFQLPTVSDINTQYKFREVTNISFSNIFGHVFKCIIGVQAMAQQYMAAKKHGHSIMFEQEVPVIRYGSGSNASYLQLDHNHCIISILFIHVMEHYNFQLPTVSDVMAASSSFWRMLCLIPIHITVYCFMMLIPLIIRINLTNLSFLYLSTGCQMICLNMWAVFVFLSMSIQAIFTFEVAIITNIIQWEDKSPMSNDDFSLLSSGLSDGLWDHISFNFPVLEPSIIKLKNYIMTRMAQQAKKTNKGKSFTNDET
eukprot:m51a1_g11692 hypothetical protein (345) ;mRNA; f:6465-8655